MTDRKYWFAGSLGVEDEPLAHSLIKYRQKFNRVEVDYPENANLISSNTHDGRQMPILDLDFPHEVVPSSTPGHTHLYINVPMSRWQWSWLMFGLYQAGVIELGFFVWSLRRNGNFVRVPGLEKQEGQESTKSNYGWFRKLKK